MFAKIGIFILATCWMFTNWINNTDGNYDKLIALLLYFIIALIASRKEK